jgi:hypothetical protein
MMFLSPFFAEYTIKISFNIFTISAVHPQQYVIILSFLSAFCLPKSALRQTIGQTACI